MQATRSPKAGDPVLLQWLKEMFKDSGSFWLLAPPVSASDLHPQSHKEQCDACVPDRKKGKGKRERSTVGPIGRNKIAFLKVPASGPCLYPIT